MRAGKPRPARPGHGRRYGPPGKPDQGRRVPTEPIHDLLAAGWTAGPQLETAEQENTVSEHKPPGPPRRRPQVKAVTLKPGNKLRKPWCRPAGTAKSATR